MERFKCTLFAVGSATERRQLTEWPKKAMQGLILNRVTHMKLFTFVGGSAAQPNRKQ